MPSPAVIRRIAAVVVVAAAAFLVASLDTSSLDDLKRAQKAGAALQRESNDLAAGLHRVAGGIGGAEGIGQTSHAIERLTIAQKRSLSRVDRMIRDQYGSLSETVSLLARVELVTQKLSQSSDHQAAALRDTLALLRTLRGSVAQARSTSVDLAGLARYGALLAEDSARSFSSR
ncbi:MAG: hypothetical protein QOH90_415 [Actinomycetota bacterium]|nr:hypothetical protein [Actinomycetota bacterium]